MQSVSSACTFRTLKYLFFDPLLYLTHSSVLQVWAANVCVGVGDGGLRSHVLLSFAVDRVQQEVVVIDCLTGRSWGTFRVSIVCSLYLSLPLKVRLNN